MGCAMRDVVVNERVTIPAAELRISFARSGGPGGQNVNKVASKVELRWTPADSGALTDADRAWLVRRLGNRLTSGGELIVTSELTRDQSRNREDALDKLGTVVRDALRRPKRRVKTRPSKAARERRIQEKKQRGEAKRRRRPPPED
jgi:ribosome-associated protein